MLLFGTDYNVGIYPENKEIASYINAYFQKKNYNEKTGTAINNRLKLQKQSETGLKLNKAYEEEKSDKLNTAISDFQSAGEDVILPVDLSVKNISVNESFPFGSSSPDKMTLVYICNKYNLDLLIIPVHEQLSDLNYLTLYAYDAYSRELSFLYGEIKQTSDVYGTSALKAMSYLFMSEEDADAFVYNIDNPVQVSDDQIDFRLETNIPADVFIDGIKVGKTPFGFKDSYPISISFEADGYISKTINLMSDQNELYVELKPQWMSDFNLYKKARTDFYVSFTASLASFAVSVISNAVNFGDSPSEYINSNGVLKRTTPLTNSIKAVGTGLSVVSLLNMFGELIDYYRYADFVSP